MKKDDKKLRSVNTHFWVDKYIVELDPSEKLLFLYLLTNPWTNLIGVYEITLRQISFDTGFEKEMVKKMLDRFERDSKIYYYESYIILVNHLKNQNFNVNMQKGADQRLLSLPPEIIEFIASKNIEGFETLRNHSEGFKTVRKEKRIEEEEEREGESEESNPLKNSHDKFDLTVYKNPDDYSEEEKKELANLVYNELKNSQLWIEDVMRATKLDNTQAWKKISDFINHIKANEDYFKPQREIKRHCLNWIKQNNIVVITR